jgi:hypothetical protein
VDARVLRSTEPGAGNGNDCDDSNAAVYPGNFETADDRDSDCDPTTIGWLDMDQDGYVSDRISNPIPGTPYINQGLDCDDEEAGIHLGAQELPNRIDDDCDGAVDNLLGAWWTPR